MLLQNRGAGFVLDDAHPNRAGAREAAVPHDHPRDAAAATAASSGALGVVGGFMQPQGQLQILRELLDRDRGPQEARRRPALPASRTERAIDLEPDFDPAVADALRDRGHEIARLERFAAGGAQLILARPDGTFAGASDRRKDGRAVAR